MRTKIVYGLFLGASIVLTFVYCERAFATSANGFVGTTVALGRFGNIDVFNQQIIPNNVFRGNANGTAIWTSMQKTMGDSDVYVQSNVWQPGGDTGWHSHPGHSLIIVTAGTVTDYESNDPDCKPTSYSQGMGFVDPGGDHVHLIRNEGSAVATTMTIQVIPANATRRIDEPAPPNCHL